MRKDGFMKKVILIAAVLTLVMLAGCKPAAPGVQATAQPTTQPTTTPVEETTEATEAEVRFDPFTDISWVRDAENDVETIRFGTDGSFRYSCACGNPVNDADLCEGYTYDEDTKTISLNFIEQTEEETASQIVVKSCDGKTLVLDFNGDVRTFQLEEETTT